MQAIEFETVVQDSSIPLPRLVRLAPGQPVRVVLLYEEPSASVVAPVHGDAISRLAANPLVMSGFTPLSREDAHER